MKSLLLLFILIGLASLQAQQFDPSRPDLDQIRRDGQLVSLLITTGNPIRIFVSGREEAKFDPHQLKLTVRRLSPYPAALLKLTREGNMYSILEAPVRKDEMKLEVKAELRGRVESFQVDVPVERH